jgi:hypothetical protein
MITNYLAAEPLLIARLTAKLPGIKILSAADLAGVAEGAQNTPAVHVLYDGDRMADSSSDGAGMLVWQRWLAVVAVRNAKTQRTGEDARDDAGLILLDLLKALQGYKLSDDFPDRLRRVAAPRPLFNAGFLYIPTAWEVKVGVSGDFF